MKKKKEEKNGKEQRTAGKGRQRNDGPVLL